MFHFPGCPPMRLLIHLMVTGHYSGRVPPFGYPWITAYLRLPMAFRSLSRPSSAISALASTLRSFSLDLASSAPRLPKTLSRSAARGSSSFVVPVQFSRCVFEFSLARSLKTIQKALRSPSPFRPPSGALPVPSSVRFSRGSRRLAAPSLRFRFRFPFASPAPAFSPALLPLPRAPPSGLRAFAVDLGLRSGSNFQSLPALLSLPNLPTLPVLPTPSGPFSLPFASLPRKEVIQPHLPIRLPCYDFTPVIGLTFDGCPLSVSSPASGAPNSHGVTGGVYKARERIHRGMLIRDY